MCIRDSSYGPGVGKPGPVDDWEKSKSARAEPSQSKPTVQESIEVEFDEKMSFGTSFDPSEWA